MGKSTCSFGFQLFFGRMNCYYAVFDNSSSRSSHSSGVSNISANCCFEKLLALWSDYAKTHRFPTILLQAVKMKQYSSDPNLVSKIFHLLLSNIGVQAKCPQHFTANTNVAIFRCKQSIIFCCQSQDQLVLNGDSDG